MPGTRPTPEQEAEEARMVERMLALLPKDELRLVAVAKRKGLTNKEIAGRLYLSPRTVEKHVERILAKTNQPNRTALAAFATELSPLASTT